MSDLKTLVEGYQHKNYKRVHRNELAYQQTNELATQELTRLVAIYKEQFTENQTARLIRDSIDHWIRRVQKYCIQGAIGSHYIEEGVNVAERVFEHVLPEGVVRNMLIQDRLTINQALNTPTCFIKKSSDIKLSKSGLVSTTPNPWYFFQRYFVLNTNFSTYNGQTIESQDTWSLADHYTFFGIS
mgnify:FL=1|tara:strand:+ start:307 stop:861 length:555 start_codon:yes stop_codon:yes gene_type:complete